MNILDRFNKFVSEVTKEDKVALFFDPDPDGITAGVLLHRALERYRGKGVDLVMFQDHGDLNISEENIAKLKSENVDKVFMVDLAVDQHPEQIEKISDFAKVCVIDHHKIYYDMNSENIVHLKPQMLGDESPVSYVTSKLVYDLFSEFVDLEDLDWLAAIGIVGDAAWRRWRSFVDEVSLNNGLDKDKVLESKIGHAMRTIASAPQFGFDIIDECFDVVSKANTLDDIERSSLTKYKKVISEEIYKFMKDFKVNAEYHKDLVFYQFKSKYGIGSTLSTRVSFKDPHKTFIVIQDAGEEFYRLSLRRQDMEVKVNDLVSNALKGLEGTGGGHVPAAGGNVKKEQLEQFKKNVIELLGL